ncbi:hypothetical protein TBK1r_76920 [Stieleria magnilauensis]|uniref:Uncharacterized protein n=1 Tax=Stieleria magnilauensis TaxID=2527963 RepID=A0ABX5Y2Z4_9BACT|nr:hypothetical protein TBK1r_76920 [Planctomycetes bacterium TBK1r]
MFAEPTYLAPPLRNSRTEETAAKKKLKLFFRPRTIENLAIVHRFSTVGKVTLAKGVIL